MSPKDIIITNINNYVPDLLCQPDRDIDEWIAEHTPLIVGDGKLTARKKKIMTDLRTLVGNVIANLSDIISYLLEMDPGTHREYPIEFPIRSMWFDPTLQCSLATLVKSKTVRVVDPLKPKRNKSVYLIWTKLWKDARRPEQWSMKDVSEIWSTVKQGGEFTDERMESYTTAMRLAEEDKNRYMDEIQIYKANQAEIETKLMADAVDVLQSVVDTPVIEPVLVETGYTVEVEEDEQSMEVEEAPSVEVEEDEDSMSDMSDMDSQSMEVDEAPTVEVEEEAVVEKPTKKTAYWHYRIDNMQSTMDTLGPGTMKKQINSSLSASWAELKSSKDPADIQSHKEYKKKATMNVY